ncbi:hypothetical protein [Flavobacterium undicola]|uniref:hypothetical protein n=1 Tax=Flavobacterium undicola TaxID=1932779 RepID=UPI00137651C0|nr:hypothetical protein [Flavobacterium undicola]MBA0884908.1 hypothetical protein [Flavobacterium undicola]
MKSFIITITTVLLLSTCLFSCKENIEKKKNVALNSINKKWIGKQIVYPLTVKPFVDTVQKKIHNKYSIVAFYDGSCSMCYLELKKWEKTMQIYKKIGLGNVAFKFVLSGNSKSVVDYYLTELGFPIDLVYYDSKDEFNAEYQFLKESGYKYSSILLDEMDNVLFIGNPTISKEDNNMFLKIIKKH